MVALLVGGVGRHFIALGHVALDAHVALAGGLVAALLAGVAQVLQRRRRRVVIDPPSRVTVSRAIGRGESGQEEEGERGELHCDGCAVGKAGVLAVKLRCTWDSRDETDLIGERSKSYEKLAVEVMLNDIAELDERLHPPLYTRPTTPAAIELNPEYLPSLMASPIRKPNPCPS